MQTFGSLKIRMGFAVTITIATRNAESNAKSQRKTLVLFG